MTDWQQFQTAYRRILENERGKGSPSQNQMAFNDGLEMAIIELKDAFRHVHVKGDDGDACAKCGFDLRDEIHTRWSG